MCRIPPEVSLPKVIPAVPFRTVMSRTTTFSVGRFTRKPSASLPDFNTMASSLFSISQFSTRTFEEESTSTPSVLGPTPPMLLRMVSPPTFTPVE